MDEIFLSASVPRVGRGAYHETANPFLIQFAVRELVTATIRTHRLVWGGQPAITPMIVAICEDLGVKSSDSMLLYQSRYFEGEFPAENKSVQTVALVDAVPGDKDASLLRLREEMLARPRLGAAVFIGGMEGVEAEFELYRKHHPKGIALPVPAPGGAALVIAKALGWPEDELRDVDFARLFHTRLGLKRTNVAPPGGALEA